MAKTQRLTSAERVELALRAVNKKQHAALMVIILTPQIRAWLAEHDPQALQQCREALGLDVLIQRMQTRQEYEAWLDEVRADHDQLTAERPIK